MHQKVSNLAWVKLVHQTAQLFVQSQQTEKQQIWELSTPEFPTLTVVIGIALHNAEKLDSRHQCAL